MLSTPQQIARERDQIRLVACPRPFSTERIDRQVGAGGSIADMLREIGLDPDPIFARVFIDDRLIEKASWEQARPEPGQTVTVRVVPTGGGGGGKDALRIVAMIAVIAVAVATGRLEAVAAIGPWASAAVTAGIAMGGTLAISALIPPPRPHLPDFSGSSGGGGGIGTPTFALTGAQNQLAPYATVPRLYGQHRLFPPYAARPYTELVGDEQYLRLLFTCGYGPLQIDQIKIGETLLSAYSNVETEIRQGYPTDQPVTLYSQSINEDPLSILLLQSASWTQRTSQTQAAELSVDVACPEGLVTFDAQGNPQNTTVQVEVEYRAVGAPTWTPAGTITLTDNRATLVRRGLRWTVASEGQYEVQLRRTTLDNTASTIRDKVYWTSLRSIRRSSPVTLPGLALIAIRIKATDQLHGTLSQLNCLCTSILKDWDIPTQTWIDRATRNHASVYRDLLQGTANARPVADSRINLPALQSWHAANVEAQRNFDFVYDSTGTLFERLREVAAAGRAAWAMGDGKFSVVRDIPQTVPVQHFTSRNSWGFEGELARVDLPHALKMRFVNPAKDWQIDERMVYADNFNAGNATKFESMNTVGVTEATTPWKDGRYHLAVATLRPETYRLWSDVENLVCTRGDLVAVSHDVPRFGLGVGHIKQLIPVGGGNTDTQAVVVDELFAMETGKSYGLRFRRSDGSSIIAAIVNNPGEQTTLTLITPLSLTLSPVSPAVGDLAMFGELNVETVMCLVKSIEAGPDLTAKLTLVDAAPGVHEAETGPIPPYTSQMSFGAQITHVLPPAPTIDSIRSDETVLVHGPDGSWLARIVLAVRAPVHPLVSIAGYQAEARHTQSPGSWVRIAAPMTGDVTEISVQPVIDGQAYDVRVRSVSGDPRPGLISDWTTVIGHTVIGKTTAPATVQGFAAVTQNAGMLLTWQANTERDLAGYEIRIGATWASAVVLTKVTATSYAIDVLTAGSTTYLISAIDTIGTYSLTAASVNISIAAPGPTNPTVLFSGAELILSWSANAGTFPIAEYEIRHGSTYAGGTIVRRVKATTYRQRVDWLGARTWWIVALDTAGNQGALSNVVVTIVAASVTTITPLVIDNTVLLRWTVSAGTLPISHYEIRRGSAYVSAEIVGLTDTTFDVILETLKGTKTYWVAPVDTAGNLGTALGSTAVVDAPPDFILRNTFRSDFFGDRSSVQRLTTERVSLHFDGVDDSIAFSPANPTALQIAGAVTIEAWIKSLGPETDGGIVGWPIAGNFALTLHNGTTLIFYLRKLGSANDISASYTNDGQWHHVAATWDGTIALNGMKLYLDGVLAAQGTSNTAAAGSFTTFKIGEATNSFNGELDEVRVWNIARSQAQIQADMTRELSGAETNLQGYWRLNEREGAAANDLAGPNNDGNLVGATWNQPQTNAVMPFPATETVADRQTLYGYTTPQAQIDALYPYVAQPVPTSAFIEEYYDAGLVVPATRIIVSLSDAVNVAGATVSCQISVRATTADVWTALPAGFEGIANGFRYTKVRLTWTSDQKGFVEYSALSTTLRVKLKSDAGTVTVNANPTSVTFTEQFLDVEAIVATPQGTGAKHVVVDFTDVPNPTGFNVHLFDAAGAPITGIVGWQARGA